MGRRVVLHEQAGRPPTRSSIPAQKKSFIQFDMRPPSTRFTVVVNGSPTSGALDIE